MDNNMDIRQELAAAFAADDRTLISNGYEPVVVSGKAPVADGWQRDPMTPERMDADRAAHPGAMNTGIRSGLVVGVDIDVTDAAHVAKIRSLAFEVLGVTPFIRVGAKGEMLVYRNGDPIRKVTVHTAGKEKIEVLGSGQQFVAFGLHPDTGKPYEWCNAGLNDPLSEPLANVPAVTPAMLREFASKAATLLTELGYGEAKVTGDTGEKATAAVSQPTGAPLKAETLRAMLAVLDPDMGRDDWRDVVAAVHAAPVVAADDNDTIRRDLCLAWSRGEIGNWPTPTRYVSDDAVMQTFDTVPPKGGGVTVASLVKRAVAAGYRGSTDDTSAADVWPTYIQRVIAESAREAAAKPSKQPTSRVDFYRGWPPSQGAKRPPIVFLDPQEKLLPLTDDGAVLLWYGIRSAHKTTIAVCTLMAAIKRHIVDPKAPLVRVAYGIGEGVHSFDIGQVPAAAKHYGIPLDVLDKYWRTMPVAALTNDGEVDAFSTALADLFDGKPPTAVVIDTMATAAQGVDENSAEIGGLLLSTGPVGRIKERLGGPLVMILAHAGKEASRGVRGHSSLEGNADAIMRFDFDKASRRLTGALEKMRGGEDGFEIEYRVTPAGQIPVVVPIGRVKQTPSQPSLTGSHERSAVTCLRWFAEWRKDQDCVVTTREIAIALARPLLWTNLDPDGPPGASAPAVVLDPPLTDVERPIVARFAGSLAKIASGWAKDKAYKRVVQQSRRSAGWQFYPHMLPPRAAEAGEGDGL